MKLFLCEKPSQGRDIARILGATQHHGTHMTGNGVIVTWCVGHLVELAKPEAYCSELKPWRMEVLPVVPNQWRMEVCDKTKKQFDAVKKLLKTVKHVVIATDADREGDVIGREILALCDYHGIVERLWLSALDDASIQKALHLIKPGSSTENLYQAGLARQRCDWLIGLNMSMAMSCLYGKYGEPVLSLGRVQTPTLKLVVDRDQAIKNFKPKDYFDLTIECQTKEKESPFWLNWQVPEDHADEERHCLDQNFVKTVQEEVTNQSAIVSEFKETLKKQSPPLCFSLSGLQKMASQRFSFSAKKTLDIAQSLYETHKATTYPRTDCGYLPLSQFSDANKILQALTLIDPSLKETINQCDLNSKSPTWDDSKITAHHGIIPTTHQRVILTSMSEEERKLYELIRSYYIAQFLGDYEYASRQVIAVIHSHQFKATSQTPLKSGWKRALLSQSSSEKSQGTSDDESEACIPLLQENQTLEVTNTRLHSKQTKPPAHFNEGSLIEAMKTIGSFVEDKGLKKILKETSGIGTEATRANIIETLIKREYLTRQGKHLFATERGKVLINLVPHAVKDPATTALWEQSLEDIAVGKQSLNHFLNQQTELLKTMLQGVQEVKSSSLKSKPNFSKQDFSKQKSESEFKPKEEQQKGFQRKK